MVVFLNAVTAHRRSLKLTGVIDALAAATILYVTRAVARYGLLKNIFFCVWHASALITFPHCIWLVIGDFRMTLNLGGSI